MAFKKGESGNPAGRKKGTRNKRTGDLRTWINQFVNDNREQFKNDWQLMDPKDRLLMFDKLLRYCLPTLQATSLGLNFDTLTDAELDRIINRLTESHEN